MAFVLEWLYGLFGSLSNARNEEHRRFTRQFLNDLVYRNQGNSKIRLLNDRFDEKNIYFDDLGDNCVVNKTYIKVNSTRDINQQIIFGLACLMNENEGCDKSDDLEFLHTEWNDYMDYLEYQFIDFEN